jgi:ABC-type molybdate transport system permease subunit
MFLADRIVAAMLVVVLTFSPSALMASNAEDAIEKVKEQSEAANKLLGDKRFFVMPIPMSNPTIGTGLGLSAWYFRIGEAF